MTLRTIVIEDEPRSRNLLKGMITEYCPELTIVAEAADVEGGSAILERFAPDVMFMDVNLYGASAFDILEKIQIEHCSIVFTTAYQEYAIDAFRYNSIDFLLKPIGPADLKRAVKRILERNVTAIAQRQEQPKINKAESSRIALPTINGFVLRKVDEINYIKADGNYSRISFNDGSSLLICKSIQYFECLLEDQFLRVHKSYIINMSRVLKYNKGRGGQVVMEDKTLIPVAIRRKNEFIEKLNYGS